MTLCKATTRYATVLCATRYTTIEHGNTPEWDATSEQAATNKPNGQQMPPTDGQKPFHEELQCGGKTEFSHHYRLTAARVR